jgi:type II secretory pathway pseudopilin PulG
MTMVEVMACIAILAVLAVLVGQSGGYYRGKARSAQCLANMRAIGIALQAFAAEHDCRLPSLTEDNVEIGAVDGAGAMDIRYEVCNYDATLWSAVCPCDPRKQTDADPMNPTYVSYLYMHPDGLDLAAHDTPVMVLMDGGFFHRINGRCFANVLYSDNRVVLQKWAGDPP